MMKRSHQHRFHSYGRGVLVALALFATKGSAFVPSWTEQRCPLKYYDYGTATTTTTTTGRTPAMARRNNHSKLLPWGNKPHNPRKRSGIISMVKGESSAASKTRNQRTKSGTENLEENGNIAVPSKSKAKKSVSPPSETATTTTKKAKKKKSKDPLHWRIDSDDFVIVPSSLTSFSNSNTVETTATATNAIPTTLIRFKIRGNPLPLRRHRTSLGFIYNPSALAQESFREMVQQLVFPTPTTTTVKSKAVLDHNYNDNETQSPSREEIQLQQLQQLQQSQHPQPLFSSDQPLIMSIVFRLKRPKSHFRGNQPGPDRLKPNAPSSISSTIRVDVDNLAKFVLDALNQVLYEDDKQIMSLHVTKVLDHEGMSEGSTEVCIQAIKSEEEEEDHPSTTSTTSVADQLVSSHLALFHP
jgi:Holliday junction resolvase RusA-like endonuclease